MIDYLHEKDEDKDDDPSMPREERQYRKILRLTIGSLKTSQIQGTYWSPDDNLRNLLTYRPSIEDMKLILDPMCYLPQSKTLLTHNEEVKRDRYFGTLQQQLIEYFLEIYSFKNSSTT
jgi:hypothetical protein